MEKQRFIVIGWTSDRKLYAFGTPTGKPFGSLNKAMQVAEHIDEKFSSLDGAVALEIQPFNRRKP